MNGLLIGGIRLHRLPAPTHAEAHQLVTHAIEPGSVVWTDGPNVYEGLAGYVHDRKAQGQQPAKEHLLCRMYYVVCPSSAGSWGLSVGIIAQAHLDYCPDGFTRFNRRKSAP